MRHAATLALLTLLGAGCVGMGGGGGVPGGDGCHYAWEYGGARVTDAYPPPAVDNATQLLDGTTLRDAYNVTGPDLIRKADYAGEDGDYWRWQFPASWSPPAYRAMLRAYVDSANGSLVGVRVIHEWDAGRGLAGSTWGNVTEERVKSEPRYEADLAANLTPQVERVRAALAPVLGPAPTESRAEMLWGAHRIGCV